MKRIMLFFTGITLLFNAESAIGQLLYREGMERENYAQPAPNPGYNKYERGIIGRSEQPKFDQFGNFMIEGWRAFEWFEMKTNIRDQRNALSKIYKGNPFDRNEFFRQDLNYLVVMNETQRSFSSRFMVGNRLRANFSPLTLDTVALNGIRWDLDVRGNEMTFVSSRADLPMWFGMEYSFTRNLQDRINPVYLVGGHFERKVGIFTVAANYVNQYKSAANQPRSQNTMKGTAPSNWNRWNEDQGRRGSPAPYTTHIVVKLSDGSRFDDGGPRLYDIYPVINGVERRNLMTIVTKGSWTGDMRETAISGHPAYGFYENRFLEPRRIPNHRLALRPDKNAGNEPDYIVMKRSLAQPVFTIRDVAQRLHQNQNPFVEVNGEDYLQFWFDIPDSIDIRDIEFRALVGNNYKFEISEIWSETPSRTNVMDLFSTYFYTVKESPGNVKDMSNLNWISLNYGQQMSNMVMGFRVDADVKDFLFTFEYNKNLEYRQLYNTNANRFRNDSEAYFMNLKRSFGNLTIGTEYFKIDPQYSTTFINVDRDYGAMTEIGTDSWGMEFGGDASGYMNYTMVMDTVDDNDDKSYWPDWHIFGDVLSGGRGWGQHGVRSTHGVWPGMDKNGDGRPDIDQNGNLIPDYAEPFLLYYVDPDRFDFGWDMNNSGVIDEREDDDKADYPYNRDTRGYHLFASYGQDAGFKYTLGRLDSHQPGAGGINEMNYGRVEYRRFVPFFGDFKFITEGKKVKDSIYDHLYVYARQLSPSFADSFTISSDGVIMRENEKTKRFDELLFRDSYVSRNYLRTRFFNIPNLNIDMKFRYDINYQNETSFQVSNNLIERSYVLRSDYRKYFRVYDRDLLIMPQVKFMAYKMSDQKGYRRGEHEQYFYPILRAEYDLTQNTSIKAGAQGFPGLNATRRDLYLSESDYDTRDYILMFSNRTNYQAHDFVLNFGYRYDYKKFRGDMMRNYDMVNRSLFLQLVVGLEPIS